MSVTPVEVAKDIAMEAVLGLPLVNLGWFREVALAYSSRRNKKRARLPGNILCRTHTDKFPETNHLALVAPLPSLNFLLGHLST